MYPIYYNFISIISKPELPSDSCLGTFQSILWALLRISHEICWRFCFTLPFLVTITICGEMVQFVNPYSSGSHRRHSRTHYGDVIMSAKASQITSLAIVFSTVYSGADQSKHQSSASLAFVIPAQMVSNAEKNSIWWRHHDWSNPEGYGQIYWYQNIAQSMQADCIFLHVFLCKCPNPTKR